MNVRRLTVLLALSALFFGIGAAKSNLVSAYAGSCPSPEDTLFTGANNVSWVTNAYGTRNNLLKSDRDLNSACSGTPPQYDMAGSTAHLRLGGLTLDWVETGWGEFFNNSAQHQWRIFTEWGINNVEIAQNNFTFPCSIPNGTYGMWSVGNNPIGSDDFHLDVSCDGGSTWQLLIKYTTNNSTGLPMGEEFRRGGTGTGMSDHQNTLQYKNSSGNWPAWPGNKCYQSSGADWNSNWNGNDAFFTTHTQPVC